MTERNTPTLFHRLQLLLRAMEKRILREPTPFIPCSKCTYYDAGLCRQGPSQHLEAWVTGCHSGRRKEDTNGDG